MRHGWYGDGCEKTQDLSQMRCETTSSVKECALRARSGDVHVARVVSLVVDAVVGLTLGLIAHVDVVVFVVAILHRIFCIWRYTLYRCIKKTLATFSSNKLIPYQG